MENRQKGSTPSRTSRLRERFLEGLSKGLSVTGASNLSGYPVRTAYGLRERNPEFAQAWTTAIEAGSDIIEDEALRRAVSGVDEPLTSMGRPVKNEDGSIFYVKKFSDTLMIQILKARRSEKYRERSTQETNVRVSADEGFGSFVQALDSVGRAKAGGSKQES